MWELLIWVAKTAWEFFFPPKTNDERLGQQEQQNANAQKYIKKEEDARVAGGLVSDDPRSVYNDPDNRSK